MPVVLESNGYVSPSMNPDLPLLASQAAIELDAMIAGKPFRFEAVKQLAQVLSNSVNGTGDTQVHGASLDPATVTVFSRVLVSGHDAQPFRTVSEVLLEALRISEALERTESETDKNVLEKMRRFCIVLADSAASYFHSLRELRPEHPYRR